MKKGISLTDFTDIKKIIRGYYKQLNLNSFNNLDEMNQFLEGHKLLKFTQIDKLNKPVIIIK